MFVGNADLRSPPQCCPQPQNTDQPEGLSVSSARIMNNRNRKPNRLQHYDYSETGYYLVTICTQGKANYFGEVEGAQMRLNDIGRIVTDCWQAIPEHFYNTVLDEFVVMPNHIHGIIVIVGNADLRSLPRDCRPQQNTDRSKMYLSKIVHGFKSSVTRMVRKQWNHHRFGWQKSFYDHVIRNNEDLHRVRTYIHPLNWELDRDNRINWNE